jgi:DNA-binding NarL/FixJ family response regulator
MIQGLANDENARLDVLTEREREVLRLMAEGLTTKAIASQLNVRFKTAACHRYRVLQKLGADSTVTAVRWAIRQGLVA